MNNEIKEKKNINNTKNTDKLIIHLKKEETIMKISKQAVINTLPCSFVGIKLISPIIGVIPSLILSAGYSLLFSFLYEMGSFDPDPSEGKWSVYVREIYLLGKLNPLRIGELWGDKASHTSLYFRNRFNNDEDFVLVWLDNSEITIYKGSNCKYQHDYNFWKYNLSGFGCTYENIRRGEDYYLGSFKAKYEKFEEEFNKIKLNWKEREFFPGWCGQSEIRWIKATESKYHVIYNNCNHFTAWFYAKYLTKNHSKKKKMLEYNKIVKGFNDFENWCRNEG